MREQMRGRASVEFARPPVIAGAASAAGKKEGEGPLGSLFDRVERDDTMGKDNWEEAESAFQREASLLAIEKAGLSPGEIRYLFGGDLLGQLIATSFGTAELAIPLYGLYGACSTMGEALGLGAMAVAGGFADAVLALASSHFATAEKQFRFPLAYGNQRPLSSTWTVTGCGAAVVMAAERAAASAPLARITGITTGRTVDVGARDSMHMGAAMAPAACHTILQNLEDLGRELVWYDKVITGDLGEIGLRILKDLLKQQRVESGDLLLDCGAQIYDGQAQDTHAGGSGCGCSALVLGAMILPNLASGRWRRVLFVPTGALLSSVSYNEGRSIPGIAHAVVLESPACGEQENAQSGRGGGR